MDETDPPVPDRGDVEEGTRTSTRTSTRNPRIEVITRGEVRRRWPKEQKQAIAVESLMPGASATEIARRYGISSSLLYAWRKALLAAQPMLAGSASRFAKVEVSAPTLPADRTNLPSLSAPTAPATEQLEIVLADGTTLRVGAQIDPRLLRRILGVLRG